MAKSLSSPAMHLEGKDLPKGWVVKKRLDLGTKATGGCFSVGYLVENRDTKQRAFLKALDYSGAFRSPDPSRMLQAMTEAYNFERDVLARCKTGRLSRIVVAIDDGTVLLNPGDANSIVQYLIFELADADVRAHLDLVRDLDTVWHLRTIHQIAVGLQQLHGLGIAHQDLKPSNVLVFPAEGSKLGDLGCAALRGSAGPGENRKIAGDPQYAPPELLYGHLHADWALRRFGCDAYLLGSMIVFLFSRLTMSGMIISLLDPDYRPKRWAGTYDQVLPYVRNAFGLAVTQFLDDVPASIRPALGRIVRELCDPESALRGHPSDRLGLQRHFSLQRYVSEFDLLARRAELLAKKVP